MSTELRVEARPTYLYVVITGTFELHEAQTNGRRFLAAGAEHGLHHFLIDVLGLGGRPSVADRYAYSEFMAKEVTSLVTAGRLKHPRLAYMMKPPLADELLFGLTVAINRGLDVTVTADMEKALRWLNAPERSR